jgi:hypothetical protein
MAKKRAVTRKPRRRTSGKPAARRASGARLDVLYRQVREILEQARVEAARSLNTEILRADRLIGRKVVEEEQEGSAGSGDELIEQRSARLRVGFGRGFTPSNLRSGRLFDLAYPNLLAREIHHAVRDESERGEGGGPAITDRGPDRGTLNSCG